MTTLQTPDFTDAIEIVPVPIVPISGLAGITTLSDGNLMFTFFQEVPTPMGHIERHVCLRTLWSPLTYRQTLPRVLPIIGGRVSWVGRAAH